MGHPVYGHTLGWLLLKVVGILSSIALLKVMLFASRKLVDICGSQRFLHQVSFLGTSQAWQTYLLKF